MGLFGVHVHLLLILLLGLAIADEPPSSEPSTTVIVSVGSWMSAYELMRMALVADRDGDAVSAARQLGALASPDPQLLAVVDGFTGAADLASRRVAFGEVSRLLVLRVAADPAAPKLKVYRCTMTPGYGYWLQVRAGLSNPYMGTSMPDCGEEVSLRQAVAAASGTR